MVDRFQTKMARAIMGFFGAGNDLATIACTGEAIRRRREGCQPEIGFLLLHRAGNRKDSMAKSGVAGTMVDRNRGYPEGCGLTS